MCSRSPTTKYFHPKQIKKVEKTYKNDIALYLLIKIVATIKRHKQLGNTTTLFTFH